MGLELPKAPPLLTQTFSGRDGLVGLGYHSNPTAQRQSTSRRTFDACHKNTTGASWSAWIYCISFSRSGNGLRRWRRASTRSTVVMISKRGRFKIWISFNSTDPRPTEAWVAIGGPQPSVVVLSSPGWEAENLMSLGPGQDSMFCAPRLGLNSTKADRETSVVGSFRPKPYVSRIDYISRLTLTIAGQ